MCVHLLALAQFNKAKTTGTKKAMVRALETKLRGADEEIALT